MVARDHQPIVEANDGFYTALTNRDLAAMTDLWFPAEWVECIHPGAVSLRGWAAVRDGWAMMFTTDAHLIVAATDVRVRRVGDVAWVSCLERLAASAEGRMVTSVAQATNVFVLHDGQWRMVVHHASAVPFAAPPEADGDLVVN